MPRVLMACVLAGSALATVLPAQPAPLRLADALDRAASQGFANRTATAGAAAERAGALAPLRGILPGARVEAGYVRTTDPIGVFGTNLRQRRIAAADFDPVRLNDPAAVGNHGAALVLEQPLFNADAWRARRAAGKAADAANDAAAWARTNTASQVVRAWYGAVLANVRTRALDTALASVNAHVRQARAMERNGMVTPSDAMLASVRAGEVEVMHLEAVAAVSLAHRGLATAIGQPAETSFVLPATLPAAGTLRALATEVAAMTQVERADVAAAQAGVAAATSNADRARALLLPRVNSFARLDWNSPDAPFGGRNNWTVGVMASWSPFSGASELGERRVATARAEAAHAMRDGAVAQAALEQAQTLSAVEVALARLAIAERGVGQATAAHRLVARKYEGGLAAIPELLAASTAEMQAQLAEAAARYALIVALADRLQATGHNPAWLSRLDTLQ
ncbi:MAG: TolC family protein [Gemmatimonadetes bacterium]|nr:TolC family protein [Gemmatimonadota bacterium]